MISKDNYCKGFSLVELMVVVAVIGILAAIAIPSYLGIQKKAARSEAKSKLEAVSLAMEGYLAENNEYAPSPFPKVYNYDCGVGCVGTTFGHPSPIGTVVKMGNNLNYRYEITVTTVDAFIIRAYPKAGTRVEGDKTIWLQSDGLKGPAGVGW